MLYGAVVNGWLDLPVTAAPASPAAGSARIFVNTATGNLDCLNSAGADCMPPLGANGYMDMPVESTPANPASNFLRFYASSGSGQVACINASGASCLPSGGGSGTGTTVSIGGVSVTNAKYIDTLTTGINTVADTVVYTAPSGRRALVLNQHWYMTGTASVTVVPKLLVSGSYYPLAPTQSNSGSGAVNDFAIGIILEAGESITASTSGAAPNGSCAVVTGVLEFDNTTAVRTVKLLSFSSGNNPLYTVTSGKSAMLMSGPFIPFGTGTYGTLQNGTIYWMNSSGGGAAQSYQLNGNTIGATAFVGNNVRTNFGLNLTLASGDALVVNTSYPAAAQVVWVNIAEF